MSGGSVSIILIVSKLTVTIRARRSRM